MNEILIGVIALLVGGVLGGGVVYLWCARGSAVLVERLAYAEKAPPPQEAPTPLTVRVEPYVRQSAQSGLIKKSTEVEIGYQYQLFVHGLPCFEPHVIVVEKRQETVVDQAALERLKSHACELAQAAIDTKAGGAASLISIVKSVARVK